MIKLIFILIVISVIFGVITYENDKVVINTEKGKEVLNNSKEFVTDKVEVR